MNLGTIIANGTMAAAVAHMAPGERAQINVDDLVVALRRQAKRAIADVLADAPALIDGGEFAQRQLLNVHCNAAALRALAAIR